MSRIHRAAYCPVEDAWYGAEHDEGVEWSWTPPHPEFHKGFIRTSTTIPEGARAAERAAIATELNLRIQQTKTREENERVRRT